MPDRPPPQSHSDPSALAVALGHEPGSGRAPTVLASGRGAMAEQILALAFAHGVRVREDADLAQVLAAVDVDSEIPVEAMLAVAEILTYVYRANAGLAEGPGGGDGCRVAPPLASWASVFAGDVPATGTRADDRGSGEGDQTP
ncbi:Type III secretion system substrate exporter, FlhB-like [Rhodospira trueperi]|uniref:Type III secretion system substrate exporter, FlhB-like n=2 Tax=Rhodospira trueperi TaxID=69960 RepID=A0A1G7A0H9_9PROT|nr:EscU/YscU/HrcU family type III secretion system export apparatus switch protein [Rhodospira trueperi]SDE07406.1 Type III secretion system substrate exporter, FlhB-like [Rhodospira trueperi]